MKICNVYNSPSHYRETIYRELDNSFDCFFIFGDLDYRVKTFDISNLKRATRRHVYRIGNITLFPAMYKQLLKDFDCYILTAATNCLTTWIFMLIARMFKNKKVFLWTHGVYGYESRKQLMVRKLYYGLSDGLFFYGGYCKEQAVKLGVCPERKIYLIHNSLDYNRQLVLRNSIKQSDIYTRYFKNENPTIIFIGRLTKVKKLELLINAVNILRGDGCLCNLVIIGEGEEADNLKKLVAELHLNSVWFYGECYDELKNAELIYNADVCVSPGNVGLTALHSMMFGTPVITHDNFSKQMPEFETIIKGKTGFFYEEENVQSLANTIRTWIDINKNNRDAVRKECYHVIDTAWNPKYQIEVFMEAFSKFVDR